MSSDRQALIPAHQIQHEADVCWIRHSTALDLLLQLSRDLCSAMHGWPSNTDTCTLMCNIKRLCKSVHLGNMYLRSDLLKKQQASNGT